MSEALPHKRPKIDLDDVASSIAIAEGSRYVSTFARFNIAGPGSLDAVFRATESGERKRLLITEEDEKSSETYGQLHSFGIPQFKRLHVRDGLTIYEIPQQIKPLSHENFFAELESSETYVSDSEVFHHLGHLWGSIQRITHEIPVSPLDATAVQNFEESLLVPIPPYDDWLGTADRQEAKTEFINSVKGALLGSNPHKSYTPLIQALEAGWDESSQ